MITSKLLNEFKLSIKSPDTEEKIDLVFYRFFGFLIAKFAHILKMTPTQLTLLGLFSGVASAALYLNDNFIFATFLFLLSGIFDSSDGQLARISKQSTKLGIILDGICDSLVTIAIYAAGIYPWFQTTGWWVWPIGYLGAILHSNQCAVLDFYHREYLYFGYGKTENDTYWNPEVDEAHKNVNNSENKKERILNSLRVTWIKQQRMTSSRPKSWRLLMRKLIHSADSVKKEKFMQRYRELNKPMLPYWRLIGVNMHTIIIIGAFYFHLFGVYIVLFDFLLFNFIIFIMRKIQYQKDRLLMQEFFDEKSWI